MEVEKWFNRRLQVRLRLKGKEEIENYSRDNCERKCVEHGDVSRYLIFPFSNYLLELTVVGIYSQFQIHYYLNILQYLFYTRCNNYRRSNVLFRLAMTVSRLHKKGVEEQHGVLCILLSSTIYRVGQSVKLFFQGSGLALRHCPNFVSLFFAIAAGNKLCAAAGIYG